MEHLGIVDIGAPGERELRVRDRPLSAVRIPLLSGGFRQSAFGRLLSLVLADRAAAALMLMASELSLFHLRQGQSTWAVGSAAEGFEAALVEKHPGKVRLAESCLGSEVDIRGNSPRADLSASAHAHSKVQSLSENSTLPPPVRKRVFLSKLNPCFLIGHCTGVQVV